MFRTSVNGVEVKSELKGDEGVCPGCLGVEVWW